MLKVNDRTKFLILIAKIILQVGQIFLDPYIGCAFSIALMLVELWIEKEKIEKMGSVGKADYMTQTNQDF